LSVVGQRHSLRKGTEAYKEPSSVLLVCSLAKACS
jgi:hypothetical protein